jgi:hypothetical protein
MSEAKYAAVRFHQRPVDVVAEIGGAKQRLLAILPVLDRGALGRRQPALEHLALGAQPGDRRRDLIGAFDQRALGKEYVVLDVERGEIVANRRHHHVDRLLANHRQPPLLWPVEQIVSVFGGERSAHRLEIVAGIQAVRNRTDVLAERLAVAQECRAREHVDLGAGIVDVILARDRKAGAIEQVGERIAEHGAAAMADMHRPGRIGGDVLDIDRRALPHLAAPVVRAGLEHHAQGAGPSGRLERQIDEARPGHLDLGDQRVGAQLFGNRLGELARLLACILRQHHGGIGGHVAVRGVARRLDDDAGLVDAGGQQTVRDQRGVGSAHLVQHGGENILITHGSVGRCALSVAGAAA